MNARFILRMTAPVVAISLLLLAFGVGAAWYVHGWQKTVSRDLRVTVAGIRAGEELEIVVREARTRLDHFLITDDPKYLRSVPELRAETEHWLGEAERWSITPHERQLMIRVREGNQVFWGELEHIAGQAPDPGLRGRIRSLIDDVLVREILEPAHEYLDLTEEEVEASRAKSQLFADRLVYVLLVLGISGSTAGLVAGFGFARRLSRSLIQLSVLIRDAAGRLEAGVGPITFSGRDLGEFENVLRLIAERVGAIVERLQQREREVLLAEQMAAVGQLAAGMAHELRNPLTAMKVLVQGALAAPCAPDGASDGLAESALSNQDLVVLEEEISRLERLVQSFLDFAQPPKPEKRVLDVRPLVEQTLAFLSRRAALSSARLELVAAPRPAYAAVDPGQLRQVVLNLVLNALESLTGGGLVSVCLERGEDGWLTLQVADDGRGLPAALGDRIFDPFTSTKPTGLGLGLSICRRIAAAHGGTLTAANRAEGGAVFTLRLLAAPGAASAPPSPSALRSPAEAPGPGAGE
jgi:two-component system, NtrC family, sensor histidine kinase HydH